MRKLRRADELAATGRTGEEIAAELEVSPATLYNWRRSYGGMDPDAAKELQELREQNGRLKRLLGDAELEKDTARGGQGKILSPAAKRRAVDMLKETLSMSERMACRAVGLACSTYWRLPLAATPADPDADLRGWLRAYATGHPCHGFRRAWAALRHEERREINVKKVHRLGREEGLQVRVHSPRKRAGVSSVPQVAADAPKVVWAIDFQFDSTIDGKAIKIGSMIDEHTRASLLHLVERSITAERLVAELEDVFAGAGGPPRVLRMDNGPELVSQALQQFCAGRVGLSYIPPDNRGTTVTSSRSTTGSERSASTATTGPPCSKHGRLMACAVRRFSCQSSLATNCAAATCNVIRGSGDIMWWPPRSASVPRYAVRARKETVRAAQLVATVVGQDLDRDTDGVFRIARRVAKDRVISTVGPQARHGHKTSAHGFDGYKGHLAADPDSEIVTATTVTAANSGDADPAEDLLAEDLPEPVPDGSDDPDGDGRGDSGGGECGGVASVANEPDDAAADADTESVAAQQLAVYGDAAYGAGPLLARLENAGARIITKVQPPPALGGRFAKDRFTIDMAADTVTCPGQVSVAIRPVKKVAVSPRSGPPAPAARSLRSAPPRPPDAPSRSAPMSPNSPVPAPPRPIPPGRPTTALPGPRSNARSAT